MTGIELVYLAGVALAVAAFLFAIRRAASKSITDGGRRPALRDGSDGKEAPAEASTPDDDVEDEQAADDQQDDDSELAQDELDDSEGEERLKEGLAKTRGGFVAKLGRLFSKKKIDSDTLDELEHVLMTADIGPRTVERLFSAIKSQLSKSELEDSEAVWQTLRDQSTEILDVGAAPLDYSREKPFVLLMIGVNGVGKTTTIGKIAAKLRAEGKKVLLAAGDTFRAAAVEQLEVWGERSGCPVVKGKDGADPSSVLFEAIKRGQDEDYDVVIGDTAGRLHTKVDLMEELKKVRRVVDKAQPGAPHETFLVLDSTTGQNAIHQAETFKEAMDLTGIVLTKLDGTAKGGVILGIADTLAVPVRYIGIGESIEDLREFNSAAFVSALYEHDSSANAA